MVHHISIAEAVGAFNTGFDGVNLHCPSLANRSPAPSAVAWVAHWQGLTLVHFPAQPEPFLTQNTP